MIKIMNLLNYNKNDLKIIDNIVRKDGNECNFLSCFTNNLIMSLNEVVIPQLNQIKKLVKNSSIKFTFISLVGKWIGGKHAKKYNNNWQKEIVIKLFPMSNKIINGSKTDKQNIILCFNKVFRLITVILKSAINLVETKMCNQKWELIQVESIPSGAISKYHKALYNLPTKYRTISNNIERVKLAQRMSIATKKGKFNQVINDIYSLSKIFEIKNLDVQSVLSIEAEFNAKFNNILELIKKDKIDPQKLSFLPVVDTSGSMETAKIMGMAIIVTIMLAKLSTFRGPSNKSLFCSGT